MILKIIYHRIIKKLPRKDLIRYFFWRISSAPFFPISTTNVAQSKSSNTCYPSIVAIVFSKDRAMQLDALLGSFFETKIGECSVKVIYTHSSDAHKKSYQDLHSIYREKVDFIVEDEFSCFKECLEHVMLELRSERVFFLVDDIVFTESVDYSYLSLIDLTNAIFSLRMGANLNFSYVVNSKQPLPKNIKFNGTLLEWKWSDGLFDWGYPLSVDGHIFSVTEVISWIKRLNFRSPSSFENSLQNIKFEYRHKIGFSFTKSKIVNIPANKVQLEVENLHGSTHQDQLLQLWFDGMAIDHKKLRGWKNSSAHQDIDFNFIKREQLI